MKGCSTCDGTGCPCLRARDWQSMEFGCDRTGCGECERNSCAPVPSPAPRPGSTVDDALDRLARLIPPSPDPRRMDAISDVATVREALERQREERDEYLRETERLQRKLLAAEAEVRRLTEMVRGHHQSLAAIGGGPCICDICSASPSDGGGA